MDAEEIRALNEIRARARRFRDLFHSELGVLVLADLRTHFGYGGTSLDSSVLTAVDLDGFSKAMISQRNDGQRDVLIFIERQVSATFPTQNDESEIR